MNSDHPSPPRKSKIPLWAVIAAFIITPFLGCLLLILKVLSDNTSRPAPPAPQDRKAWTMPENSSAPRASSAQASASAQPAKPFYTSANAPHRTSTSSWKAANNSEAAKAKVKNTTLSSETFLSVVLSILGIIGVCVGGVNLLQIITWMVYGIFDFSYAYDVWELITAALTLASGTALLYGGFALRKVQRLRRQLKVLVGKADHMALSEIISTLSCSHKSACKAVQSAVDKGDFGSEAYLDYKRDMLVVRGRAPEAEPKAAPTVAGSESQYQAILRQLREVNNAIPGEEMTEKINKLEDISKKIFDLAEKNPDKLPQMRKFLGYYLPTSLKLLNTYAQLDAQGVEGENISESKRSIEETMDTLCDAFAAQLDKLFRSEALDVSTDIAAMQSMLQQDGLAEDENTLDLSQFK